MRKLFFSRPVRTFTWLVFIILPLFFQNCSKFQAQVSTIASSTDSGLITQTHAQPHIDISWASNPSSAQDSFVIEQSTDGTTFSLSQKVAGTATTASITGLNRAQKYFFRIKAVNAAGESLYSQLVTAEIPAAAATN